MTDSDAKDKVFAETNVDEPRNENLAGRKSSQVHAQEAQLEQQAAKQRAAHRDRQPDEVKASADILPADAELKAKHSEEENAE